MNPLASLLAAIRTRIVRLAEGLASRVAAFMGFLDRRTLPIVPLVAEAGIKSPVVLAAVLVAAAGCPILAPLALIGLKHLAFACVLDVVLRRAPWDRLAAAGRGLRAAAAVGLLWLAAASFDAGWKVAPRPVAAAAVSGATVGVSRPASMAAMVPGVEAAASSAGATAGSRAGRAGRLKAAPKCRA